MRITKPILVLDVDGVLIDASQTYLAATEELVGMFSDLDFDAETQIKFRNRHSGANNDDVLTAQLFLDANGFKCNYSDLDREFNRILPHMMDKEVWLPRPGLLEELAQRFQLAIWTGRPVRDLIRSFERFDCRYWFNPVVTCETPMPKKPRPHVLQAMNTYAEIAAYVGDMADDQAAADMAGVPFIGVGKNLPSLGSGPRWRIDTINDLPSCFSKTAQI
jgi:phosphoglycolate phosphatase-like HAD superfamily hydrolase